MCVVENFSVIKKLADVNDQILTVAPIKKYFSIVLNAHQTCGHGGRDKVIHEMQKRYVIAIPVYGFFQCKFMCIINEKDRFHAYAVYFHF